MIVSGLGIGPAVDLPQPSLRHQELYPTETVSSLGGMCKERSMDYVISRCRISNSTGPFHSMPFSGADASLLSHRAMK